MGADEMPASGATDGTTDAAPVAATEPVAAAETTPTGTTRETAPKPNKRNSLFGGLFGKKDAASPTPTETNPAVAKDEPSTVSSSAPQLDNPVTEPTATAAPTVDTTTEAPATTADATSPASNTTPTGNRRTSFFSNLGTKKERKAGATSESEVDGEAKKGGLGGLLRKASRAQGKNSGASGVVKEPTPEVPSTTENTAVGTNNDGAAEAEKPAMTEGETGATKVNESHEQTPVSAAA